MLNILYEPHVKIRILLKVALNFHSINTNAIVFQIPFCI